MLDPDLLRRAMPAAGLGLQFAIAACGGMLLGHWLDGRWGTEPWLLFGGALLGFVLGIVQLLRGYSRLSPDDRPPNDRP